MALEIVFIVCVRVSVHIHVHVEVTGQGSSPWVLEWAFTLYLDLRDVARLAIPRVSCFCLLSAGITGTHDRTWLTTWVLEM